MEYIHLNLGCLCVCMHTYTIKHKRKFLAYSWITKNRGDGMCFEVNKRIKVTLNSSLSAKISTFSTYVNRKKGVGGSMSVVSYMQVPHR